MVRKLAILNLLLTFFSLSTLAQDLSLSGSVRSSDNESIPFVTVMLHQAADSSVAKVNVSDGNGNYRLNGLLSGRYYLEARSMGFRPYFTEVIDLNENRTLPLIELEAAAENLAEVTVKADKAMLEVLPDKTIFNVSSDLATTGTDGMELLRKAPGVIIDNNDNIILEGKSGVIFYVNGRQLQLAGEDLNNYLKNIQADQIESVELITQPSSKYDAAGAAGIINIKLKKDLRFGTNGTVTSNFSYGKYGRWQNSLSVNHRNRKFNFYGNYANNLYKRYHFFNLRRQQSGMVFDQKSETVTEGLSQNLRAGVDFFATTHSTFGLTLTGTLTDDESQMDNRTPISAVGADTLSQVLVSDNFNEARNSNLFVNANYRWEGADEQSLTMDLDYGLYKGRRNSYQPNVYYNGAEDQLLSERIYEMNTPLNIYILSAKSDYAFQWLETAIGLGAKASKVSTDNSFKFYDVASGDASFNDDRSNDFSYEEQINAAYLNLSRAIGKLKAQAGLRAEQTISEGLLKYRNSRPDSLVERNYLNWFPSGGLSYELNQNNSFALTYSRRIMRPNYEVLNPFEYVLNELSFRKGNPFLQPQYTDNLKFTHTYKYTLNTAVSYSYVSDFFAQVTDTVDATRSFITTLNVADQQVISISISYPFKVNDWWDVYASVNAYQNKFTANTPGFEPLEQKTLSFYGQNTFKLPGEWSMQLSGWFNTPSVWGGTFRTKSMGSLDLSFQKRFWEDKLSFRLAFSDILYTSPWRAVGGFNGLRINGTGGRDSRQVSVSLSYNFGNQKVKAVKLHEGGLDQESERL